MMMKTKALVMLSGGLDSILATKLILNQGIEVEAINFQGFFCSSKGNGLSISETAKELGVPLKIVIVGSNYLSMLRSPKHGYGKNMNPCIDCKILMLKDAKEYAKKVGASFILTGEVLNERPMSQHFRALNMIEEESGLKGRLLRPLSARLLPETIVEKQGIVNRSQLLSLSGRSRKPQIKLAEAFGISRFPSPAGGCLLTESEFSARLRDLLNHRKRISVNDANLLKVGRHFRFGENKLVVGRDENENKILLMEKGKNDMLFEASEVPGPITVLKGRKTKKAVQLAAAITAFYSDIETGSAKINYGKENLTMVMISQKPSRAEVDNFRVKS